mmetsp:Transcript_17129/g.37131  ORF Transcript_17129/g.37131 Transcript_17129/m.37131 type:complete len:215 (-) Transcript_17129:282-926(-)
MVIQFGFVTMFAAAFPLAAVLAYINNIVEVRVDAIKLVRSLQKPVLEADSGIGMWESVLASIVLVALITNAALLTFTSGSVARLLDIKTKSDLLFLNLAGEHVFIAVILGVAVMLPTLPHHVRLEERGQNKWLEAQALPESSDDGVSTDLPGRETAGDPQRYLPLFANAALEDVVPCQDDSARRGNGDLSDGQKHESAPAEIAGLWMEFRNEEA